SSVTSCLLYGLLIANHLQYVFDSSLTDILLSCRHYLGLSVTKKIIQNHNGTLKMTSNEDGTTFTISIPILPKTTLEKLNQCK
ncbi:ATP-binding protein, partial [Bacillus cereus group sp. MYBK234-1]|uniref:ATP-binding protein n=1 Tax=unclassified Bacillus cereus group TaxID=2750818 RepID=UPI003F79775D